jgi:hypothetical protein
VKVWEIILLLLAALLTSFAIWLHLYRARPQPVASATYRHFGEEPHDRPVSRPVYDGQVDYNAH